MKLIVGLGNPGKDYEHTRHNIGRDVVKELCEKHKVVLKRGLFGGSLSARCRFASQVGLLAIPVAYMNLSGPAVKVLVKKHKIALEDLIVVVDDLDLEPGKLKIKTAGSSGGHKGLESIIAALGTGEFCRLRVGIGRPENKFTDVADYVLAVFKKNEQAVIAGAIEKACAAVELWVENGVEQTMNIINR